MAVDGPLDAAVCICVSEGRGDLGYLLSGGEVLVPVERVCEGHLGMFAVLEGVGGNGCAEVGDVGAPFQKCCAEDSMSLWRVSILDLEVVPGEGPSVRGVGGFQGDRRCAFAVVLGF